MGQSNAYDVHEDLLICRYKQGVQLMKPTRRAEKKSPHSISNIYQTPLSIYFFDNEHVVRDGNEVAASLVGKQSVKEIRGKAVNDYANDAFAVLVSAYNNDIKRSKCMGVVEESGFLKDNILLQTLSFKFPWYYQDTIIGVFGCSIKIDSASLSNMSAAFSALLSTGLLNTAHVPLKTYHGINFSLRENAVLEQLIRGKTAKQIGEYLHLSPRTIEAYIENMKLKASCKSKSELVDKFFDEFMQ